MKRILPPTYFLVFVVASLLLHYFLPIRKIIYWPYDLIGIVFLLGGVVLNLWADRIFKEVRTTVKPGEEPSVLVDRGPFKLSRNPMYLGMELILLGLALLLGSLSVFAAPILYVLVMEMNFIPEEEAAMEDKFGEKYREYKKRVRRWL